MPGNPKMPSLPSTTNPKFVKNKKVKPITPPQAKNLTPPSATGIRKTTPKKSPRALYW